MRDFFHGDQKTWRARLRRFFLDLDSRIDFGLYQIKTWGRELYERFTVFMDRFHVSGWRRWYFVEPMSEGLSLGTLGLIAMLALAIPAFRETSDDDWVKKSELAVTFLDRYGNEVGTRGIKHNDALRLDEFPDHLIKATLATEDRRFYDHFGIDIPGLFRAMLTNARAGGVVQGGSSISQQLAKNLFLTNERTIERKVKEAFLAMWLEVRLPKNEILKLYLDRAYMGGGTFGVDAAAQYYFNKSARDVNLAEAAMLAGLFKAPSRFAPHINLPAARARANVVLDNLVEAGFMTEGQVFGARRNPAMAVDRRDERSPNYYLDWAFDEMKKLANNLPKSVHERVFVVRLSLDVGVQKHAERTVESLLKQYGRDYRVKQAAAVLMDIDGGVRAMVGGRDYSESQFNRATDAARQPGSSFKPYVYATALMSGGFKPTSVVVDSPVCIGNWCPKNYSGGHSGAMTLTQAITRSINVIPVKLSIALGNGNPKIGREKIRQLARKAGIRSPLPDTPSMPIGADEVTVLDHTGGYTMFVNIGKAQTAARRARSPQRRRRSDLALGPRRQEARAGDHAAGRPGHEHDDEQGGRGRHRPARHPRRHQGRRQDRHHQRAPRRLVRGLHRQLRVGRLVRQRRLHPDAADDRRLAAGPDLARHHGICPPGRRAQADPGSRPERRDGRPHDGGAARIKRMRYRTCCGRRC